MFKIPLEIITGVFGRSNGVKNEAMKKILLVIFVILLAQVGKAQGFFCLGPKVGFNSNTLTDNLDSIHTSINNSFQIGAFMRIGSKLYLQPEANYQVVKGTMNKNSGLSVFSQKYTLKTIKIPVLIGYKLVNEGIFNLRVMAGPAFTYVVDKKLDPSIMNDLWPIKSEDDLKNSTWSVQMGAGLDVLFMTLDVRYEFGVENMYGGDSGFKMKNNIFNVSLGAKLL